MHTPTTDEVLKAAAAIVAAFEATDTQAYFSKFDPDASFVFHSENKRLNSRAEYEEQWQGWLENNWQVISCRSTDHLAQTFPGGAIFTHTVHTAVSSNAGKDAYIERETIVFRSHETMGLVAVHEHLSPTPFISATTAKEASK